MHQHLSVVTQTPRTSTITKDMKDLEVGVGASRHRAEMGIGGGRSRLLIVRETKN